MKMLKILVVILFSVNFAQSFVAERDIILHLNTRRNIDRSQRLVFNNTDSILNSNFDRSKPLIILIHGFREGEDTDLNMESSKALLRLYDFNVVFVDWSSGSQTINYVSARRRIRSVANVAVSFINLLNKLGMIDFNRVSLVGFSLGAHTAGLIAKQITTGKINTIIGLDPAGPLFSVNEPSERLDADDAQYVECIHTNGIGWVSGIAGIGHPICGANFYPNGGSIQPGCWTNGCSHVRAIPFYIESLGNNQFWANQCQSTSRMNKNNCRATPGAWMGGHPFAHGKSLRGIFYLETNRNSPFGQGIW